MLTFQRVLIPVDFSEHSKRMLRDCMELFDGADGQEFHFLYVWHPPAFGFDGDPVAALEAQLGDVVDTFQPSGEFRVVTAVRTGHPATTIVDYAERHECDLIALATHGHTGAKRLVLGSTAENVVRYAPCHVLTARIPDD